MVRAMGPMAPRNENGPTQGGRCPMPGMRPGVGFSEQMPVKCAGTRTEPPLSLPSPPADMPAAIHHTTDFAAVASRRDGGLYCHRQASQRSQLFCGGINRTCLCANAVGIEVHQRIDLRVQPLNLADILV